MTSTNPRRRPSEHREAPVPAVAREPDDHGRQAHRERQAARELDVGPEQQDQGRDQQLAAGDAQERGHDADPEAGRHAGRRQERPVQGRPPGRAAAVAEQQHRRDRDQQHGDDAVQGLGPEPRGPARAEPGAEQAAGEQVGDHGPLRRDGLERHRRRPERQGRGDDREAHRLVEDDRLQGGEAERTDQQRQAELRPAQADQPSPPRTPMAAPPPNAAPAPRVAPRSVPAWAAMAPRYGGAAIAVAEDDGRRQPHGGRQTFGPASGRARRSSASRSSAANPSAAATSRR